MKCTSRYPVNCDLVVPSFLCFNCRTPNVKPLTTEPQPLSRWHLFPSLHLALCDLLSVSPTYLPSHPSLLCLTLWLPSSKKTRRQKEKSGTRFGWLCAPVMSSRMHLMYIYIYAWDNTSHNAGWCCRWYWWNSSSKKIEEAFYMNLRPSSSQMQWANVNFLGWHPPNLRILCIHGRHDCLSAKKKTKINSASLWRLRAVVLRCMYGGQEASPGRYIAYSTEENLKHFSFHVLWTLYRVITTRRRWVVAFWPNFELPSFFSICFSSFFFPM